MHDTISGNQSSATAAEDDDLGESGSLVSPSDLVRCAEVLEAIDADRGLLAAVDDEQRTRLLKAAGLVSVPGHRELRKLRKEQARKRRQAKREADAALLERTGIRAARTAAVFATPGRDAPRQLEPSDAPHEELSEERGCYVCKTSFRTLHPFYDSMCGECGDFNWTKRTQSADLSGRVALVTGSRVKIGYQAGIKLLRAGCRLIVTTRFPVDAAARYAAENDFSDWKDRLQIYGLDLRHTPSVEAFCQGLLRTESRLDFIINNACQTVRRPPGFYAHLMDGERDLRARLDTAGQALVAAEAPDGRGAPAVRKEGPLDALSGGAAELSQIALLPEDLDSSVQLFPDGALDADLQQRDLRTTNSWRLMLDEVPAVELLEVHLVNAVAPFVLNARLKPLMLKVASRDKHIVNVSAVEGQFYRTFKTARHPHTNMAKASLNMMTRTSAPDYVRDGIHMNSVDTGWVTDEDPVHHADRKREEHGFHPPLDIVDGAARIVDPIFSGLNTGEHLWGRFLKDYKPTDW
ncbi:MAG: oxidoreductase [Deltaproteobacteria bacterium]|nr:oxidoreductase [Deltaproteobacteria bacterium]